MIKTDINAPLRIVTATSLYDGHDATINIMRRIMQDKGAEVVHLGHNRGAKEIVSTALEEDAGAIAITSYQGGHNEYLKYIYDMLKENDAAEIKIFGGGGGVITPAEIKELEAYGICKIFSPADGAKMGLEGMIDFIMSKIQPANFEIDKLAYYLQNIDRCLPRAITLVEYLITLDEWSNEHENIFNQQLDKCKWAGKVVGFSGVGGSGKSSLIDEIVRNFQNTFDDKKLGIIAVDPSKVDKGALLGDRIRMNSVPHKNTFMRSIATRKSLTSLSNATKKIVDLYKMANFDLIILETAGTGQNDLGTHGIADLNVYVMTPEYGAALQLEKINLIDCSDIIVINKFDKEHAEDALYEVRKQFIRSHKIFTTDTLNTPVYKTVASSFNDKSTNYFFKNLLFSLGMSDSISESIPDVSTDTIIPKENNHYLSNIAQKVDGYFKDADNQIKYANELYAIRYTKKIVGEKSRMPTSDNKSSDLNINNMEETLNIIEKKIKNKLTKENLLLIEKWPEIKKTYSKDYLQFKVREKEIQYSIRSVTLSGSSVPKISLPKSDNYGEILKYQLKENLPGYFPFTGGVFPLKRQDENPTRMFAGEGTPEKTNRRFHYLSKDQSFNRLSTAFDSITLYGHNPDRRPDIYGKIGNAGVSIATLDDAKKLYSGFNLMDPNTSVSMTINGPSPIILAMFFNTAIDQQVEKYLKENGAWSDAVRKIDQFYRHSGVKRPLYSSSFGLNNVNDCNHLGIGTLGISGDRLVEEDIYINIKTDVLQNIRGTLQADILKEDQAQNTCLFSIEFALKLMGSVQVFFADNNIKNFYSISVSGYHMAEAGANPITQLAFTLANGFTYVEYFISLGLKVDDFAKNISFFFSNGLDIEYSVIGRVARRIWAIAMKFIYSADEKSQKLKYHIQTSGRSLHAQEMAFNDIRTTLQALVAIYDNCNSLHTNAYDEAVTTPTEESVRRALAIQMIANSEFGVTKNENPLQGSYLIEELTDLVEKAVLDEFKKISRRGGVLGAMESRYQRNKIQSESSYYEHLKNSGELPIIGVNTFVREDETTDDEITLSRSTDEEKNWQINNLQLFHKIHNDKSDLYLKRLMDTISSDNNVFEELMETVKYCSLGQITNKLFGLGGEYRRNM